MRQTVVMSKKKENQLAQADIAAFAGALGYCFKNQQLLELALTHSSWAAEAGHAEKHNERLEFLGDAVLELCVSTELYRRFTGAREGDLTCLRSALVNETSLAKVALEIGLDCYLKLGIGEERQGGRKRPAILADALEAVLGAIYEDGGFVAAQFAVNRIFASRWPEHLCQSRQQDCKSLLQQVSQHMFRQCPVYSLAGTNGPEHAKIFDVRLRLPDGREFFASNTACRKAEQDAAAQALAALGEKLP